MLGPYDRYNYGDLLFAHMVENELASHFDQILFFSTTASDLSAVGGKPTLSMNELYDLQKRDSIEYSLVVAGGESLFTTWGTLASFIFPRFKLVAKICRVVSKIFGNSIGYKLLNFIGRKWLKGQTYLPLSVSKSEMKVVDYLFYNSLGGCHGDQRLMESTTKFKKIFDEVDHLAVREEKTQKLLENNGIISHLVPDSAILMSKYFPHSFLEQKVRKNVSDFVDVHHNYIFFQVNALYGLQYVDVIVDQLEKIASDKSITICLCPIGMALGHSDFLALENISSRLNATKVLFTEDITIWEIMYLIANSKLYAGTSLHGAITAMSFNIPYIGLHIDKLDYYLKAWGVDTLNSVANFDSLYASVEKALEVSEQKLKDNLDMQTEIAEQSFKTMVSISNATVDS